jgi:broad specificity phosphatase PhoE
MKTTLFLARHAEVESKYHRVFGGRIDMALSPRGHAQAGRLARWLSRHTFDAVYASPMRRVQLTLDPMRQYLPFDPIIVPELREVDFGDWTGLGWDDVETRFQVSAYDWLIHLERDHVAGAESVAQFRSRTKEALHRILTEQAGKSVLVYCHGGVIRMLLSHLLDLPLPWFEHVEIDYASATRIDVGEIKAGRPRTEVQLLNFTPWRDLSEPSHE